MVIKLGLIGDNIAASQAPDLHRKAGALCGLEVTYDRFVPPEQNLSLEEIIADCEERGYRGLNITYPYKERACGLVQIDDPRIKRIGSINTILFGEDGRRGWNTDFTGFVGAWRQRFGSGAPGPVLVIGAGGVGKAVCHGLIDMGIADLRLFDIDTEKSSTLSQELKLAVPATTTVSVVRSVPEGADGAEGVINCTPVGMVGKEGQVIDPDLLAGSQWVFDAVYTPLNTAFLQDARANGLSILSGYELFFHQGVHAFHHFTGETVDETALRHALGGPPPDQDELF